MPVREVNEWVDGLLALARLQPPLPSTTSTSFTAREKRERESESIILTILFNVAKMHRHCLKGVKYLVVLFVLECSTVTGKDI